MPRQLKSYVTTNGFFELAVAAPSMKAAIETWGASPDIFQRGYASVTTEPSIVKATMNKPGVVLKRGVGVGGAFKEDAELPKISLLKTATGERAAHNSATSGKSAPAKSKKDDPSAQKQASQLYELAQQQREREKARVADLERKASIRRQRSIAKTEAALAKAGERHDKRRSVIERKRAQLESSARREDERWSEEKRRLEDSVREAHL
jgi:hypothetical protein